MCSGGVIGWYGADVTPHNFYENFIEVMVTIDGTGVGDDAIRVTSDDAGEGEQWTATRTLRLEDGDETLVVAGARDQLAGTPQGLADAIPGAKAVTLPGCDHFSCIGHPLFKASVFDFFDGWLD